MAGPVSLTKKMAFGRAFALLPTFIVILMVVSPPFVQASRTRLLGGTTNIATQELQTNYTVKISGNGGADLSVEVSARQVPTGPNPLHHH